jgi:hypothetical protein
MAKRMRFRIFHMAALEGKYPNAVKEVTVKKEDYSELRRIGKACVVLGETIPGVVIIQPDGKEIAPPGYDPAVHGAAPESED